MKRRWELTRCIQNVISNPAARIFKDDAEALGKADKFPYVGTTYRLTEHFHYWTKHALLNAILQPEQFVEIGESLANKLGIAQGDTVKSPPTVAISKPKRW